eukprot:3437877-Amphidinium_carterae.4
MIDRLSAWERQIEEHEGISDERIADSVKCAVIQKGMPAALRTYLLVNSPNVSDWTAMRRSMQSHLLATASAPKPVPMDLGKDAKGQFGYKGDKGKGDKKGWYNNGGKEAKVSRKTKVAAEDRREREETPEATDEQTAVLQEKEDESLLSLIIVDDRQVEETPVAEVSTSDEHYGVVLGCGCVSV